MRYAAGGTAGARCAPATCTGPTRRRDWPRALRGPPRRRDGRREGAAAGARRARGRAGALRVCASAAASSAAANSALAALKLVAAVAAGGAAGRTLPAATSVCLSSAAFNVVLPAFLLGSVGRTVAAFRQASASSPSSAGALLFVPAFGLFQIGAGLLLGAAVDRAGDALGRALSRGAGAAAPRPRGWHPSQRPASGARAIAAMTAKSIGIAEEQGERVLLTRAAREEIAAQRALKQRIFYASCMYGNTFTLPLLILSSLLASGFGAACAGASAAAGALQERAVGFLALYLVTWSPMLWGVGKLLLSSPGDADDAGDDGGDEGTGGARPPRRMKTTEEAAARFLGREGPDAGRQLRAAPEAEDAAADGIYDITAASASELAAAASGRDGAPAAAAGAGGSGRRVVSRRSPLARARALASSTLAAVDELMTPPLYGVFLGIAVGVSPLAQHYFPAAAAAAAAAPGDLPLEVRAMVFVVKLGLDVAKLFGGGALAMSTLVLALALFPSGSQELGQQRPSGSARGGALARLASRIVHSREELVELAKVCTVRLVLLPLTTLAAVLALRSRGLLPHDPSGVLVLVMLVLSAMPSAQNLIVLINLCPGARRLGPRFARVLMLQYFASIATSFVWLTVFQRVAT